MKRVIICTAGHVDHGKTALVLALTGIDCDTHPEEKARGITINPGFAHLDLPSTSDGSEVIGIGIVDVPGHHRFIRNMLAGACAVDLALLVVAADDGVMPQTREHVALLNLLGTRQGVVALTKTDIASPDLLELAQSDIQEALAGTFLADAEIVRVSAILGTGLDELRAAILRVIQKVVERPATGGFRMYIDRIFSVAGFGTVVTGSILGGTVHVDDTLHVLPGDLQVRVRRIECHGSEVKEAHGGERTSLNISGLSRAQFARGMMLADRPLPITSRIDAELTLIGDKTRLGHRTQALLYTGTHESSCQVHLLDRARAASGEQVLAQIELLNPAPFLADDRFVLRSASADQTIGGGRCIDPAPLHHRRRTQRAASEVRRRASSSLLDCLIAEVGKRITFVSMHDLATILGSEPDAVRDAAAKIRDCDGVRATSTKEGLYLLSQVGEQKLVRAIRDVVDQYHRDDPLGTRGVTVAQVASKLALRAVPTVELTAALLDGLVETRVLRRTDSGGYQSAQYVCSGAAQLAQASEEVKKRFRSAGMTVVVISELENDLLARFNISAKDLKAVLRHLVEQGELIPVDDAYLATQVVADSRCRLLERLNDGAGISVADYRDLISGNRRICLLLLSLFDREGITRRNGDLRVITEKGKAMYRDSTTPKA